MATKKKTKATETKSTEQDSEQKRSFSEKDFPVVGVGASAGGLEAFGKLLGHVPNNTGMAFVLIQHLDPTHASNMVELLRRYTRLPVHEATDALKLEPDHVYMIPPNKGMTITDRTLKLVTQVDRPGIMHSIDLFFRSLATDLKEKAICIILSGTGSDGALGAKAVKAELGMVMVQEPDTAGYDGMPRSAIAAGVADYVLPAENMPKYLVEYVEKSYGKRAIRRRAVERDSASLTTILSLIRARTKHDFSGYKQSTINRRIERRMGINQIDSIGQYLKFLREHPPEVDALVKDFLINITSFFRDPDAFVALKEHIRSLFEDRSEGSEIRAWVPGCSSGEEAYSLAIVIEECQEELHKYFHVQVFGTDLDPDAVAGARSGLYSPSIAGEIGDEILKKFFARRDDQLQVKRELREKLIFAVQDIIADPPFTKMDIISARNLLIYFDADLQKRLIPMFHYALNQGGLLFLGTAETVGDFSELFLSVDRRWKIYRAENKTRRPPALMAEEPSWREQVISRPKEKDASPRPGAKARSYEETLLDALAPSVLLDSNSQMLFAHGNLRKFLGVAPGTPNANILDMVHPELRAMLASGLHEAAAQQKEVVREGGAVKLNGDRQPVRISVRPVATSRPEDPPGQLIVTFQELPKVRRPRKGSSEAVRVSELEQELQFTRETLRSTIEELETANEELRSSNEEYQSTNEELQSTNEELETSREELQSLNEELSTVNTEHQAKIEELSTVNDDMKNLLNSTGIATIYLDNSLRIKRFTPAATTIFNLISSDVDRPISHITSQVTSDTVPQLAKDVLDTLVPVQQELQTADGKWHSMRITPYRTNDNSIAGVVVTFVNISEQERVKTALGFARAVLDALPDPVLVLDSNLRVISANRTFYQHFKVGLEETEGKQIYDLDNRQWDIPELRKLLTEVASKNKGFEGYTLEHDFQKIGHRKLSVSAHRVTEAEPELRHIAVAIEDVTGGARHFGAVKG